ncbi:MAG: hypothetical protein AB1540_04795 [Bdellovibrionota bacterium]
MSKNIALNCFWFVFVLSLLSSFSFAQDELRQIAEKKLESHVSSATLSGMPEPTHDFIYPIREQVIEELSWVYQERRAIAGTLGLAEIDAAIETSFSREEALLSFFERYVSEVGKRYDKVEPANIEVAKTILEQKSNLLAAQLTKIAATSDAVVNLGEQQISAKAQDNRDALIESLTQAEILTQEIAFQLAKITQPKTRTVRNAAAVTQYWFFKGVLVPATILETVARLVVFPGLPGHLMLNGHVASGIGLGVGMVVVRKVVMGAVDFAEGLVSIFTGGRRNQSKPSYFRPNLTLDLLSDLSKPKAQKVLVAAPSSAVEAQASAVSDRLRTFFDPSMLSTNAAKESVGYAKPLSFLSQVQSHISYNLLHLISPCERALTGPSPTLLKLEAYVSAKAKK